MRIVIKNKKVESIFGIALICMYVGDKGKIKSFYKKVVQDKIVVRKHAMYVYMYVCIDLREFMN